MINLALPVRSVVGRRLVKKVFLGKGALFADELLELGGVQNLDGAGDLFGGGVGGEFNPNTVGGSAFLGGDQDDSVGRSGTVDGRG